MDVRGRSGPFDQKIIYVGSRSTEGHAGLDTSRSPEIRGAPAKEPRKFQGEITIRSDTPLSTATAYQQSM